MSRYTGWRRLSGDTADRPDLLDFGKKLLGHLAEQRRLSGVKTLAIQRELPDGSIVQARFDYEIPSILVRDGGRPVGKLLRRFRQFAVFTGQFFDGDFTVLTSGFTVTHMEDYVLPPDHAKLQVVKQVYTEIFASGAITYDARGPSVSADARSLQFTNYAANANAVFEYDIRNLATATAHSVLTYGNNDNTRQTVYVGSDRYFFFLVSLTGGLGTSASYGYIAAGTSVPIITDLSDADGFNFEGSGDAGGHDTATCRGHAFATYSTNTGCGVQVLRAGLPLLRIPMPGANQSFATVAISQDGKHMYVGTEANLHVFSLTYNLDGVLVAATRIGGAFMQFDAGPTTYSFLVGEVTPNGKTLYASYGGAVNRQYLWEFDTSKLLTMPNLIDPVSGDFVEVDGARRLLSTAGAGDLMLLGMSADGKRLYLRTNDSLLSVPSNYRYQVVNVPAWTLVKTIPHPAGRSAFGVGHTTYLVELPPLAIGP